MGCGFYLSVDFFDIMKGLADFISARYKGLNTTRANRDLCKELLSKVFTMLMIFLGIYFIDFR